MSGHVGTGTAVAGTVLAAQLAGSENPAAKAMGQVASGLLPLTGIAVGLYVLLGVTLIVFGVGIRLFGSRSAE